MAKKEPPPEPQPGSTDEFMRTKAHIEQGVANLVDLPAFEQAGMSPAEAEAERRKDDLAAYAALTRLSQGKDLPGDQAGSGDGPGSRRFRLVGIGIALVIMAVAIAIAGWWLFAGDDTTNSSAGVAAPAAPVPDADAAQPAPTESTEEPMPSPESTTTTDCVLSASTVQVAIANDHEEPSTFTTGLMLQVWDVNFTNNTAEAVVVGAHYTSTRNGKVVSEEWVKRRVDPGRTEHESGSRDLTVNGKRAEQASLIFDRVLVVENRDVCVPLLDDPQVQAQAVELPVPPTP